MIIKTWYESADEVWSLDFIVFAYFFLKFLECRSRSPSECEDCLANSIALIGVRRFEFAILHRCKKILQPSIGLPWERCIEFIEEHERHFLGESPVLRLVKGRC